MLAEKNSTKNKKDSGLKNSALESFLLTNRDKDMTILASRLIQFI